MGRRRPKLTRKHVVKNYLTEELVEEVGGHGKLWYVDPTLPLASCLTSFSRETCPDSQVHFPGVCVCVWGVLVVRGSKWRPFVIVEIRYLARDLRPSEQGRSAYAMDIMVLKLL